VFWLRALGPQNETAGSLGEGTLLASLWSLLDGLRLTGRGLDPSVWLGRF
jgi:hypothetical protein